MDNRGRSFQGRRGGRGRGPGNDFHRGRGQGNGNDFHIGRGQGDGSDFHRGRGHGDGNDFHRGRGQGDGYHFQRGRGQWSGNDQGGRGQWPGNDQRGRGQWPGNDQRGRGQWSGNDQGGRGQWPGNDQRGRGQWPGNDQRGRGQWPGNDQGGRGQWPGNDQGGRGQWAGNDQRGRGHWPGNDQGGRGQWPGNDQRGRGQWAGNDFKIEGRHNFVGAEGTQLPRTLGIGNIVEGERHSFSRERGFKREDNFPATRDGSVERHLLRNQGFQTEGVRGTSASNETGRDFTMGEERKAIFSRRGSIGGVGLNPDIHLFNNNPNQSNQPLYSESHQNNYQINNYQSEDRKNKNQHNFQRRISHKSRENKGNFNPRGITDKTISQNVATSNSDNLATEFYNIESWQRNTSDNQHNEHFPEQHLFENNEGVNRENPSLDHKDNKRNKSQRYRRRGSMVTKNPSLASSSSSILSNPIDMYSKNFGGTSMDNEHQSYSLRTFVNEEYNCGLNTENNETNNLLKDNQHYEQFPEKNLFENNEGVVNHENPSLDHKDNKRNKSQRNRRRGSMVTKNPSLASSNSSIVSNPIDLYSKNFGGKSMDNEHQSSSLRTLVNKEYNCGLNTENNETNNLLKDNQHYEQFPENNLYENNRKRNTQLKKQKDMGNRENPSLDGKDYKRNNSQRNKRGNMYTKNPSLANSSSSIVSMPIDLYSKDVASGKTMDTEQQSHSLGAFVNQDNEYCGTNHPKNETKNPVKSEIDNQIKPGDSVKEQRIIEYLNDLINTDPEEIVQTLTTDDSFSKVLNEILEPKMLLLVVDILAKVCTANLSSERGQILRLASLPAFLDQVFHFVSKFPFTEEKSVQDLGSKFFENIVSFYETLLDLMPSAMRMWKTHLLEVEKSVKATTRNIGIAIHADVLSTVKYLLNDINSMSDETDKSVQIEPTEKKKKEIYYPDPVGDFRTVSLFPRPEDVFFQQPFLYPNIIDGPFGSVDHYLDTHFKLLREDFMSPIRQAIHDYKKQSDTKGKFKRIDNVRIYRKVKFLNPKTIFDKVGYEVCFDVDNKINRVNWEFSNRFMYGSLLLFTDDDFDTFFLATVANRNVRELENKRVIVELQGTTPNARSVLGKQFVMAESEAYFNPYFHVLKALQQFNQTNFPLARYIVYVDTATDPPAYLSEDDIYTLVSDNRLFSFRVLNDFEWPTHEDLRLDPSQYGAFKAALTNDIVVIQGPPGTGKTFLGLQIAKTLLTNTSVWNSSGSPILVVCFTNHALDQFLEGLLSVTSRLVRYGGKSKGSELDKFNIRERRKEYSYYKKTKARESRAIQSNMSAVFAEIKVHQNNLQILDDTIGILSLKTLELVMTDYQRNYFHNDDYLMDWLLVGMTGTAKTVKITVSADKGIVKETAEMDPVLADSEDQHIKQAFFDTIDLDPLAKPSEEAVTVYFACSVIGIEKKLEEIKNELGSNRRKNKHEFANLKSTSASLDAVLKHLRKELLQSKGFCSDFEKQRLQEEVFLNNLNPADRWKLYHLWVEHLRNGLVVELEKKEALFRDYAFNYEQLRQTDDIGILRTAHVVGTTTTLAAQYQPMFTALAPKIVIVEEAAEVLEAHIIASLTQSCQHLILIGDHKQLRPSVAEVRLARQYHLDVSLFERMVNNGLALHTLSLQHRMRPEISQQLVPTIYPTLQDHESVRTRDPIRGMDKNVFFMTHKHFEDEVVEITSKRNQFEAGIVLGLAKYLVLQGYKPQEITILATYKGQMYQMKNEIKNMKDFPKGIQITVVDNFQGEENKIILLSLVRSNAMNKIGFLEIENRVCVALSRARDGMYIVGNMDNLVRSSEIWPHIKDSLVRQDAFGPALRMRCQIHTDEVTSVSCVADFSKVSEGGCSRICGQELPCNHTCKSLCHLDQNYHRRYRCKERCSRILCDAGHQCPKKCHMECEDCQVIVDRDLPCGHKAQVPCSLDIRNFKCQEEMAAVVELCGHIVRLPCHQRPYPTCNLPCPYRLECGHSCERVCHKDDDPEHTEYKCEKPCPRLNKDCAEDHKCRLLCHAECESCAWRVDKRLPCGHSYQTICSKNPATIKCQEKCVRRRTCGHLCTNICWEPCEPCPVVVDKQVPECGHLVRVACSQAPTKQLCAGACSVQLACGHTCTQRCKDPCAPDKCETTKHLRMTFTSFPCGHKTIAVPCNKTRLVKSMPAEEQMQFCDTPCGRELTCKHICSGTCGECMQGRIHKVCDRPCGNILICGHSCEEPCREECPPCDKPCRLECKHSKCLRKCGQVCVSCKERCGYKCPHLKCSRPCGELCNRPPCYEDCPKKLVCSHPCVGFCGEPCPPCRQCEPHHFQEFFYTGEETEDDAKWVYLEDCKHTFESSGLEYWLNLKQEGREIVCKMCPRCKTPIVKVQRFMNLIKSTFIDIQRVKSMCFGQPEEIRNQRLRSLSKLQDSIHSSRADLDFDIEPPDKLGALYIKLKDELPEVNNMKKRNMIDEKKVRLLCFKTEFFISLYTRKVECWPRFNQEARDIIAKKINALTDLLMQRQKKITEQEMVSFELELKRIQRLFDLLTYTSSPEYSWLSRQSDTKSIRSKAEKIINSPAVYSEETDQQMLLVLGELKRHIKSATEISSAERAMINEAMQSSFRSVQKTGHWFKCKNGHIYCITECGGAMEQGVCPVAGCGERIGGQNHALLSDQALASEMDGASHAAWSDANNMANFGFNF